MRQSTKQLIDLFFPSITVKCHSNDKPWINKKIKSLIRSRQQAFSSGNDTVFKKLRNQVKREIEKGKVNYFANRVRNLQTTEPRKWHQQIRTMTRKEKSDLYIPVPGIDDSDHDGIANYINKAFINVSSSISPLDITTLEAFLPACSPAPKLHPWVVYEQLKKIKANKASGPDGISPKIIKEFAYEFSSPICDILNSSYTEGVVPSQWKKAIVVPIPKTNPPKSDKLRPVSLSDCFAKVAETFIADLILEYIPSKIDLQQYGNVNIWSRVSVLRTTW